MKLNDTYGVPAGTRKCDRCDGTGSVITDDEEWPCPQCAGNGVAPSPAPSLGGDVRGHRGDCGTYRPSGGADCRCTCGVSGPGGQTFSPADADGAEGKRP